VKILVTHPSASDRKRLVSPLVAKGHTVIEIPTIAALQARVQSDAADVLLLDWTMLDSQGPRAIGFLRDRSDPPRVYVIAMSSRASQNDFAAAERAGVDDFLRLPVFAEELLMRVNAPARIATWAHAHAARSGPYETLAKIKAWKELDALIGKELGEMMGLELKLSTCELSQIVHASDITISIANDRVEIRLALGIDGPGTEALGAHLLGGDTSPAAIGDALRELANTAAGAFKRAALADGANVAISIPSNRDLLSAGEGRRFMLRGDNRVSIACAGIARLISPKRVLVKQLEEGMVVIRDVRTPAGALLLPAGTCLTATTARRLADVLEHSWSIEVNDPRGDAVVPR
jgi:DNA-binding response OmpR family regulator